MDESRGLRSNRVVQGITDRQEEDVGVGTEGGGKREQPQRGPLLVRFSFPCLFCFSLSSSFEVIERLWRAGKSSGALTVPAGAQPLRDFAQVRSG